MILYGYKFFVIDHGWEYLTNVDEFLRNLVDKNFSFYDEDIELFQDRILQATNSFKQAKALAKRLGWEGDFSQGPSIFFIPDPDRNDMSYGFVFKQYNNGVTFVISPIQLGHLAHFNDVNGGRLNRGRKYRDPRKRPTLRLPYPAYHNEGKPNFTQKNSPMADFLRLGC